MKIGIITQPLSRNYGGILQNYALQQTLIKLGHTPYTFDLDILFTWKDWTIRTLKSIVKLIIGRPYTFSQTPYAIETQEKILRSFVDKNIQLIEPRVKRLTVDPILKNNLDAIIVGSDQVWRPIYNYDIKDMYLYFAKDLNIKRIAYAASFGTDEWEYTEEQTQICENLAQRFDAISVREQSGVELCKKYFNIGVDFVIDPTLLLTAKEYNKLLMGIPESKSRYLFAYVLDKTEEKIKYVKTVAKDMGMDIVIKGADAQLAVDDSIENWLSHFRNAEYIITDSFHGSVFSIIFNKPFVALGNKFRGVCRLNSLLGIFSLENRLVDLYKNDTLPLDTPNWVEINDKINTHRNKSLEFLKVNL